ncbi:MAG TPA: sigma-70 family RNA polymerase sigma factor [Polyangiaceae bacterium]
MQTTTSPSDAALVVAALAREAGAASAIVERYRGVVRRCLWSPASHDVDDLVQEAFARCFESLPRLRDPSALRSFVIGIALRVAANERRRRRRRWREFLTQTGELPEATVDDGVELHHAIRHTREMLGRLGPDSLRVLELRFVHEKELTEIADGLGVSLATAKRYLARASARLRAMAPSVRGLLSVAR